ncbi:LysR family transcriptional regulator [Xaviernesmea oryzae]|uniref:DNA-binding transcriptional regulator, LysR family n=1 Tax=Xaviernesmea oryzae TaxID=464029 RepID=A0A1X7FU54_9HYPH|nr:LysR family transcriptional regulator [Xaviernesmea oryzae]SMF58244.1 DNA-binding transcriptional regulator, LysR family [Xaviernesmea oryzae]
MKESDEEAGFGLKRARAFREVIRSGSTRRAARSLGVTQSAVSQQLKLFEELIGEKLFVRDRRGLIPTTRAIEIYNKIDRYFETLARIENEITGSFGSATRSLTIAAPHLLCLSFVPKLIHALDATEPGMEFYVRAQGYDQVAQSILTEEADIGISRLPLDDRFFEWHTIALSKSVCLLPSAHPLANKERITLNDLDGERFIILEREFASHQTGLNALLYEGRNPVIKVRTDAVGFVVGYVSEGLGISIANEFIARQCAPFDLQIVPFHPPATYEYVLFWRRGAAKNFEKEAFVQAAKRIALEAAQAAQGI